MKPSNSSTSNSEPSRTGAVRDCVNVAIWFVLCLVALDAAVGIAFRYPDAEQQAEPGALERYFDYGRSIEGKVRRMVGPSDDTTAPVARAGWLDPDTWTELPNRPERAEGWLVAIYGMSFAQHVGEKLETLRPDVTVRFIGGPAAPVSHSYTAYMLDRNQYEGDVVILGVLASSVRALGTLTGMTWAFESPYPYTYPKYEPAAEGLEAVWPTVRTLGNLRSALQSPDGLELFVDDLRTHDSYFDPFLFEANVLDRSTTVRLIRRGWGQRHDRQMRERIHSRSGFNPDAMEVQVLNMLLPAFAREVRDDGRLPIVLLIHDQGYGDHLYRAVADTLEAEDIPFVSTHAIAPTTDPSNYVADGHFVDQANVQFAQALLDIIESNEE